MIYLFTFVLAFCSIVYELLLGQSLSAFLGNTVLRYSVTIGLYMLSMGIGALFTEGRFVKRPLLTLLRVELLLTLVGGFSVLLLHVTHWASLPGPGFSIVAYTLIAVIGVLSGSEIPLLVELAKREGKRRESTVLGVDYLGAFAGTVAFAFLFYPRLGIVPTAFLVASLNGFVGALLMTRVRLAGDEGGPGPYRMWLGLQTAALAAVAFCLANAHTIDEYFLRRYLGL